MAQYRGMTMEDQTGGAYALVLHEGADPETGGIAICGFSTVGMVGVIAASHVISSLGLSHLGTVLNTKFPAIALVHDEIPKHPVRVYQGKEVEYSLLKYNFQQSTMLNLLTRFSIGSRKVDLND